MALRPSALGMLIYSDVTSQVTSMQLQAKASSLSMIFTNPAGSLTQDLILGTYGFSISLMKLDMCSVGQLLPLMIGLPGIPFLCVFGKIESGCTCLIPGWGLRQFVQNLPLQFQVVDMCLNVFLMI